jgi:phosphatidylserine/phosphatidylglycerophosphate/cardiolipin synthase-like enzyme
MRLDRSLPNEEVLRELRRKHPNSEFVPFQFEFIWTYQKVTRDINRYILNIIGHAKSTLQVVQPYYFPIKKIENAFIQALKRGVSVCRILD